MRMIYERVEVSNDGSLKTLLEAAKGNLDATIEIDTHTGYYDSIEVSVYVCWIRGETPEEEQAREAKEKADKEALKVKAKKRSALKAEKDYREYLKLKERYKDV